MKGLGGGGGTAETFAGCMACTTPNIFEGCCAAVGLPHSGQNLALSKTLAPHPLHFNDVEAPQDGQNFEGVSPRSKAQLKHFIWFSNLMLF
jgi:hypothetical protein